MIPAEVSFEDCKRELLSKTNSQGMFAYTQWRNRTGYEEVVRFVEDFRHRFMYSLKPDDVTNLIERTGHALGDVQKEEAIKSVQDFTCPFALQHVFHELMEDRRTIPTWEDFDAHINGEAFPKWMAPFRQSVGEFLDVKVMREFYGREETWRRVRRATRWRLGNFYLSAIRELDLFVRLREMGVPLRYHVLADVLLRVDFWTPDKLLCVYFKNTTYRARKKETEFFFSGIPVKHAEFERQGFGKVWVAGEPEVRRLRDELASENSRQ